MEKREGNKLIIKSENINKIQVISTEKNAELLTLTFCCKVPNVDYSEFFHHIRNKMGYFAFWNGIRKEVRKEFKLGKIWLDDIDYPALFLSNKYNGHTMNQIVFDVTFINPYGPKWKNIINQDEVRYFVERTRDIIIQHNMKLIQP